MSRPLCSGGADDYANREQQETARTIGLEARQTGNHEVTMYTSCASKLEKRGGLSHVKNPDLTWPSILMAPRNIQQGTYFRALKSKISSKNKNELEKKRNKKIRMRISSMRCLLVFEGAN
jgi:hypothetical protein